MDQFGGYVIDKTVHDDDNFVIYHAKNQKYQSVYLKTPKAEFPDLKDVARLQREDNLIRQFNSEEIIKTLGLVRQGHQVAMVMEGMPDAITLHEYCKNKPCNLEEFLIIATKLVQGLMIINENKIIHKNLTPSNILYSPKNQQIKIMAFGFSTHAQKEKQEIASLNISSNSLPYIAPEQTGWSNIDLDYRSDFYSLGCTFYEMLTGKPPFSGEKRSDYFKFHISQMPPLVHEINTKVPEVISNIIAKLLEKAPENRYQSSYGLYKDLLKCQSLATKAEVLWSFPLAEDDIADQFIISNRLYGRAREISILKQEVMDSIERNKLGLISVSGFSGIGKTALVKEMEQQIKLNNGIFASGKFDQYQRDLPYQGLSEAFGEIIDRALESDEKAFWVEALNNTLHKNGRLIIDLVPKLKNILKDPQPLPDLGAKESYNRFLATVNEFIQIFTKPGNPLVMFIDDLQWAPAASLNLLQDIGEKNKNNPLILIFSYRSNEVDSAHRVASLFSSIEKLAPINKIELLPLGKEDINKIVTDVLHTHQKSCEDLSEIIYERSTGNPFFVNELLNNLHEQRYIDFDYGNGKWRWDIDKIRSVKTSDNVAEFMVTRLLQLPASTLSLLKKAACIGNRFDSGLLANVAECDAYQLAKDLETAVKAQVLILLSISDETEGAYNGATIEREIQPLTQYKFQHDRIQQAIYEMIAPDEKPAIHLLIGKTLKNNSTALEINEKIVTIADHMNKAISLIISEADKLELAKLNLAAGIKAKASIAYQAAFDFLKVGISLLEPVSWKTQYQLTYDLYEHFSQSAFLCGELAEEQSSNEILLAHARTSLEKAKIHRMRAVQHTLSGKAEEALDDCIEGLRLLGIKFKKNVTSLSVLVELIKTKFRQGFKPIAGLIDLPLMQDPEKIVAMQLLLEMAAPCYTLGNNNLFAKSLLRQVSLSIQYGTTKESPAAYAAYGLLLNAFFNQPSPAFEFGKMAVKLNEKLGDVSLRCRTLFVYYVFIYPWNLAINALHDVYPEVINAGYQSGDLLYVTYAIDQYSVLPPKDTLGGAVELGRKYIEMVTATKYEDTLNFLKIMQQFKLSLQDRENAEHFRIGTASEAEFLENVKLSEYDSSITGYLIKKVRDSYLFLEYQQAYGLLDECERSLEAMLGSVIIEEYYFFAALTLARHYESAALSEKKKLLARIRSYYQKVRKWASRCEVNFLQHALLLEATLLRLKGKNKKAADIYQKAIEAAQKNNFLHEEALACEEAAYFFNTISDVDKAQKYLKQAHYAYLQWGALAKVKQLESIHQNLKPELQDNLGKKANENL